MRSLKSVAWTATRKYPVVAIAVLIWHAAAVGEALACRGPFRSVSDIVGASASVFTAKVVSRVPVSEREHVVELRVTAVLKGGIPETLTVNEIALIHPNDNCLAIESGEPFPRAGSGEEWLVSGNLDANRHFVPTTAGNFRLAYPDGKATEGRDRLLGEFRKTLARMLGKSGRSGQ